MKPFEVFWVLSENQLISIYCTSGGPVWNKMHLGARIAYFWIVLIVLDFFLVLECFWNVLKLIQTYLFDLIGPDVSLVETLDWWPPLKCTISFMNFHWLTFCLKIFWNNWEAVKAVMYDEFCEHIFTLKIVFPLSGLLMKTYRFLRRWDFFRLYEVV